MDLIFRTFVEDLPLGIVFLGFLALLSLMALTLALFCFYLGDKKLNFIQFEEPKILM